MEKWIRQRLSVRLNFYIGLGLILQLAYKYEYLGESLISEFGLTYKQSNRGSQRILWLIVRISLLGA